MTLMQIPISFAEYEAENSDVIEVENVQAPVAPAAENEKAQQDITSPGNVTIDFKEADINNVLRILSYKSGVNIVAGKDVKGAVTVRLVDVPWEKALDVVLKTYGFAYERDGNIIRVATVENLGEEPLKTEVFKVNYGKADEIALSIKEMVSPRGSVRADKRSNTIIVTDIPTNTYKIEKIIAELDKPIAQVYIDARIIETLLDDDEKLGIDWTVQVTARGSKIPTTLPFTRDLRRADWLRHRVPLGEAGGDFADYTQPVFPDVSDAFTGTDAQWAFGTLDFSSFQAVLQLLNSRSNTKIISNPRMITLDNQTAEIRVGNALYIPVWEESETTGKKVFSDVKKTELDTGILLKVTPHVNSTGEIVVDLEPEVTSRQTREELIGATTSGGQDAVYAFPISVRKAKTQVMIKDGETIAMGGLLNEQLIKIRRKVPFLGDLPFLGNAFKYTEDTIDTRDMLIFVTVRLVKPSEDTAGLYDDISERMDKMTNTTGVYGHEYNPDTPMTMTGKKEK